jgi:hypothetical protein
MWTVYGTDGALILSRHLRPRPAVVAAAIMARRAELAAAAEEAAAEERAAAALAPVPAVLPRPMPRRADPVAFGAFPSRVMAAIEAADWMAADYGDTDSAYSF